jgi:hypothetical protein
MPPPWPVQSFLKHFRHEFEYYIEHKRSWSRTAPQAPGCRMSARQNKHE